jgi:gas vesicle protein
MKLYNGEKYKEIIMTNTKGLLSGLILGVISGIVIGSATALLTAAQPGEETRAQLLTKGDEIRVRANEFLMSTRQKADVVMIDIRNRTSHGSDQPQIFEGSSSVTKEFIAE